MIKNYPVIYCSFRFDNVTAIRKDVFTYKLTEKEYLSILTQIEKKGINPVIAVFKIMYK